MRLVNVLMISFLFSGCAQLSLRERDERSILECVNNFLREGVEVIDAYDTCNNIYRAFYSDK